MGRATLRPLRVCFDGGTLPAPTPFSISPCPNAGRPATEGLNSAFPRGWDERGGGLSNRRLDSLGPLGRGTGGQRKLGRVYWTLQGSLRKGNGADAGSTEDPESCSSASRSAPTPPSPPDSPRTCFTRRLPQFSARRGAAGSPPALTGKSIVSRGCYYT